MKNQRYDAHQDRISSWIRKAIFLIMVLCAAVYAKPAFAVTETPSRIINMKYPIVGNMISDSSLYNGGGWYYVMKSTWSLNGVTLDPATTSFESGKSYDFQYELQTKGYTTDYARPSENGWGIEMTDLATFGRNIEKTYIPDDVTVEARAASGSTKTYYYVTLKFRNIRPLEPIEYNQLSFRWENYPSGGYKEGDSFEYDIVPSPGYGNQYEVPTGGVKWYSDSFISPISYTSRVTGGQYYNLELTVVIKEPYEIDDWSFPKGVFLDFPGWPAVESVQAVPDEKKLIYRLQGFTAVKTIDELSVSGLTAPAAGNKPTTAGITLATADSNPMNPVKVTATDFTWGGTLDPSGNFLPGQHYTLTMDFTIDYSASLYEYKGAAKSKVSVSAGTVENVTYDGTPFGKLTIGFDTPKQSGEGTSSGTAPSTGGSAGSVPATGTVLTDKGGSASYTVTSSTPSSPGLAYTGTKKKATSITIPNTVTIDGVTYKITSIAPNAFKGNKKIKKVTIGTNVVEIGKKAFYGCTKLASVNCKSKVLKKIGASAFQGDKKLAKITLKTKLLTSKNVGKKAFKGTSSKLTIKVPSKVKKSYTKFFKKKGNTKVKIKK